MFTRIWLATNLLFQSIVETRSRPRSRSSSKQQLFGPEKYPLIRSGCALFRAQVFGSSRLLSNCNSMPWVDSSLYSFWRSECDLAPYTWSGNGKAVFLQGTKGRLQVQFNLQNAMALKSHFKLQNLAMLDLFSCWDLLLWLSRPDGVVWDKTRAFLEVRVLCIPVSKKNLSFDYLCPLALRRVLLSFVIKFTSGFMFS